MGRQGTRDGYEFSFYQEKQNQKQIKTGVSLIWESSLLPWRWLECCRMWFLQLSKWSSLLSINQQNKTALYYYFPTKLPNIYKWITNSPNANNGVNGISIASYSILLAKNGRTYSPVWITPLVCLQFLLSRSGVCLPASWVWAGFVTSLTNRMW